MRPQMPPKGGYPEGGRSEKTGIKHRKNRVSQMRPQKRNKGGFPEGRRSEKNRSNDRMFQLKPGNQTHLPHRCNGHFADRHRCKVDRLSGIKLPHQERVL